MSQKAPVPNVGLIVLTGEDWRIERNKTVLLRELATQAYRVNEVRIVTDHDVESERANATVLICHSGFSPAVYESNPVNDIAWLCFITIPQNVSHYKSPFDTQTSVNQFLGSIPYVWAPSSIAELGITLEILRLRNKATI